LPYPRLLHREVSRVFSPFITKELKTVNNIKNRKNRQNATRILTIISTHLDTIQKQNKKGLFIFVGISDEGKEIFEVLEPVLQSKMFYYNCAKKFVTDIFEPYYDEYNGSIIFASGDECIIYKFNGGTGKFEKFLRFDSRIGQKHKKGGQSSVRMGRIADGEREKYCIAIIEHVNKLGKDGNWIFGSQDIIDDIFQRKNQITSNLNNGGYISFDIDTISDTKRWVSYMKNDKSDDELFAKTLELFEVSPELLEFDPSKLENLSQFQYVIITPKHPAYNELNLPDKIIKLPTNSKFYGKLSGFVGIGKYYYSDQSSDYQKLEDQTNDNDDFM
jgi:hypothetical protein